MPITKLFHPCIYFDVTFSGRFNQLLNDCNAARLVYTELICSITGAESVLNNLCDRELLVGGTIIQEVAIDKSGWMHLSVPNGCVRRRAYINKTACRSNRSIGKRPCMKLSRADDSPVRAPAFVETLKRSARWRPTCLCHK